MREHAEQMQATEREEEDQTRATASLRQSLTVQAKQEATASLDVLRANARMIEAQKIIEKRGSPLRSRAALRK